MPSKNRCIFISDIHMGHDESVSSRKPYVWFKDNIPILAQFLSDQINARDVKEVVILGDLFDQWIIPADYSPITSFESICSSIANQPVIANLRALANGGKLVYVPGNHDMPIDTAGIAETKEFLQQTFPGVRFICDDNLPLGKYEVGSLVAEHGNRYCLFNAPDSWTNPGVSFLPLGYFISRMVAYKVSQTGHEEDPRNIFFNLLKSHKQHPNFIDNLFQAIAMDCGLKGGQINVNGVADYAASIAIDDIGNRYGDLSAKWGQVPGAEKVGAAAAIESDEGSLFNAAATTYFHRGTGTRVVIFGHTHTAVMTPLLYNDSRKDEANDPREVACRVIYANSGTWVDLAKKGGTYVETEETDENRLYVRIREYPGNTIISDYERFVEI